MDDDLESVLAHRRHRSWLLLAWVNSVVLWLAFSAALAAATCSCSCARRSAPVAPPRVVQTLGQDGPDQQRARAVKIETACLSGDVVADLTSGRMSTWNGSGTIIGDRVVLTASHVVVCPLGAGAIIYVSGSPDNRRRPARVLRVDLMRDLAELEVADSFGAVAAPALAAPVLGEVLCMEATEPAIARKCGTVDLINETRIERLTDHVAVWVDVSHTAITIAGNSGSGVWDERGRLVCVVTHSRGVQPGGWCSSLVGRLAP